MNRAFSCEYCNCNKLKEEIDLGLIKRFVDLLYYGNYDVNNCYDFCLFNLVDINQDRKVDMFDINQILECIENKQCNLKFCEPCKRNLGQISKNFKPDKDGKLLSPVKIDDLLELIKYYLDKNKNIDSCILRACDLNRNGVIDLEDIYLLAQYLYLGEINIDMVLSNITNSEDKEEKILIEIQKFLSDYINIDYKIPDTTYSIIFKKLQHMVISIDRLKNKKIKREPLVYYI
jgi:hypothetical protein